MLHPVSKYFAASFLASQATFRNSLTYRNTYVYAPTHTHTRTHVEATLVHQSGLTDTTWLLLCPVSKVLISFLALTESLIRSHSFIYSFTASVQCHLPGKLHLSQCQADQTMNTFPNPCLGDNFEFLYCLSSFYLWTYWGNSISSPRVKKKSRL